MTTNALKGMLHLAAMAAIGLAGCNPASLIPLQPADFDLAQAGVSNFEVEAGVPESKTATFSFDSGGLTLGRGNVEIDPNAVSLDASSAKALQSPTCQNACNAAGVDQAICDMVCQEGLLDITVHVGSAAEVATVCDTGDEFNFQVELNAAGQAVSISPNSINLNQFPDTLSALNSGEFSLCITVISPEDGEVVIDALRMNVGV